MKARIRGRVQLRTRVLAGVLLITLVALVAFDVAAVTAVRKYLFSRTDSNLHAVLSLYRPVPVPPFRVIRHPVHTVAPGKKLVGHPSVAQVKIVGPHLLLRPAILDQYYLGFLPGRGHLREFVQGNPDLKPMLPPHLHGIAATYRGSNVISSNGRAQLRIQAVRIGGGTLFATTSLASAYKTLDRSSSYSSSDRPPLHCWSSPASRSCCAAACVRSRPWRDRLTGSTPATSPTG